MHRGALRASYITHKKSVKRCFVGQMKKHLEPYVLDEGILTVFFFFLPMSKRCFINLSKCQRVFLVRKGKGVITHPSAFLQWAIY